MALRLLPIYIIRKSSIYETDALLPNSSPKSWNIKYLNMVVSAYTNLSPHDMLKKIKKVEKLLKRHNYRKWSPRTIDIDILLWGNIISENINLIIPHPELHKRDFVLQPLYEIAKRYTYNQQNIKLLLQGLNG